MGALGATGRFYFIPNRPAVAVTPSAPAEPPLPPVPALPSPNAVVRSPMAIAGAGAMFPYPIYALWSEAYKKKTASDGTPVRRPRAGIRQVLARSVPSPRPTCRFKAPTWSATAC